MNETKNKERAPCAIARDGAININGGGKKKKGEIN